MRNKEKLDTQFLPTRQIALKTTRHRSSFFSFNNKTRLRDGILAVLLLLSVMVTLPKSEAVADEFIAGNDFTTEVKTNSQLVTQAKTITSTRKLAGADRYETSVAVAKQYVKTAIDSGQRVTTIIIASGESMVDAMTAVSLSSYYDAPIILTRRVALPQSVISFIDDEHISRAVIVGGIKAVSSSVALALRNLSSIRITERISGPDRFSTAVAIADIVDDGGTYCATGQRTIIIVNGSSFADAVVITPLAYALNLPLLLTNNNTLPLATQQFLARSNIERIIVIGGTAVVSDAIMDATAEFGVNNIGRFAGNTRYGTSVIVSQAISNCSSIKVDPDNIAIVNGTTNADGIVAGPLLGMGMKGNGVIPILLVKFDSAPSEIMTYLEKMANQGETPRTIIAVGGPAAISEKVMSETQAMAAPPQRLFVFESKFELEEENSDSDSKQVENDNSVDTDLVIPPKDIIPPIVVLSNAMANGDSLKITLTEINGLSTNTGQEKISVDEIFIKRKASGVPLTDIMPNAVVLPGNSGIVCLFGVTSPIALSSSICISADNSNTISLNELDELYIVAGAVADAAGNLNIESVRFIVPDTTAPVVEISNAEAGQAEFTVLVVETRLGTGIGEAQIDISDITRTPSSGPGAGVVAKLTASAEIIPDGFGGGKVCLLGRNKQELNRCIEIGDNVLVENEILTITAGAVVDTTGKLNSAIYITIEESPQQITPSEVPAVPDTPGTTNIPTILEKPNTAPVITTAATLTFSEIGSSQLILEANDAEDDDFDWAKNGGADAALFNINSNGEMSFKTTPDFENPMDADGNNVYEITVVVTDRRDTLLLSELTIDITIINIDEDGIISIAPLSAPQVGTQLTTSLVDLDTGVSEVVWQWQSSTNNVDYTDIVSATDTTYAIVIGDVGKTLRVRADYNDNQGINKNATSKATKQIPRQWGLRYVDQNILTTSSTFPFLKEGDTIQWSFSADRFIATDSLQDSVQFRAREIMLSTVDLMNAGSNYTATYVVQENHNVSLGDFNLHISGIRDINGNPAADFNRSFNEFIIDTIPPVITLEGDALVVLTVGDSYNEPNPAVSGIKNTDRLITIYADAVGDSVDLKNITDTAGLYTITYTVIDRAGNTKSVIRTLRVTLPATATFNRLEIGYGSRIIFYQLTPVFNPEVYTYIAHVPAGTTRVVVRTSSNEIEINGILTQTGFANVDLTSDMTIIPVILRSYIDNSIIKTYSITIIVDNPEISSDATLSNLWLIGSGVQIPLLEPRFSSKITEYTVFIPMSERNIRLRYILNDSEATDVGTLIRDNQIIHMGRTATTHRVAIIVTAEDGTMKTYALTIIRLDYPGIPTNFETTLTNVNQQVKITWDKPGTGGSVDRYEYKYTGGTSVDWIVVEGGANIREVLVNDLSAGVYYFQIRAYNARGVTLNNQYGESTITVS